MKIASSLEIEQFGEIIESEAFTIKSTGKAFEVLSSKLYKDKIRAIVRELSCNAYDSHVAAGCPDRPFDVHLPSARLILISLSVITERGSTTGT